MAKLQHIHLEKLSSDEVFGSKLVFSLNAVCLVFCVVTSSLREQHSNNLQHFFFFFKVPPVLNELFPRWMCEINPSYKQLQTSRI